jgi:DMSO/TMAO reductase YedYZ molybdopterin-dependent catalytic subunit
MFLPTRNSLARIHVYSENMFIDWLIGKLMDITKRPGILTGALVGLLFTVALMAIFYLVEHLLGTPFVPFDVFDWVARVLPGPILTFGIDTLVSIIRGLNLGQTDTAAKTAELSMAIIGMIVTGAVGGAVLFGVLRRMKQTESLVPGLILGLVIGLPVTLISLSVNLTATANPVVSAVWIIAAFLVWGVAIQRAYDRLSAPASHSYTTDVAVQRVDRRRFLVSLGGATAAITVVGTGVGALLGAGGQTETETIGESISETMPTDAWSENNPPPNADAAVQPAPGTRSELTPVNSHYRTDINVRPPSVDESSWRLVFGGLVDEPVEMTLDDLKNNYDPIEQFITLACISNPVGGDLIGTTLWTGVPLRDVLKDVTLKPEATHLRIIAAASFDVIVDLETVKNDGRVMLAYYWDGLPLTEVHGFPLRIYIPNHFGMKQPKWITNIEAISAWEEGYWVRRGWDKDALMHATSVIDTVGGDAVANGDGPIVIPIGGIAHAGDRGISKVEVQVDGGDWQEAQLRDPISDLTWVVWRYDWPFESGEHIFAVRCYEGDGTLQIVTNATPHPSGATGIDTARHTY